MAAFLLQKKAPGKNPGRREKKDGLMEEDIFWLVRVHKQLRQNLTIFFLRVISTRRYIPSIDAEDRFWSHKQHHRKRRSTCARAEYFCVVTYCASSLPGITVQRLAARGIQRGAHSHTTLE